MFESLCIRVPTSFCLGNGKIESEAGNVVLCQPESSVSTAGKELFCLQTIRLPCWFLRPVGVKYNLLLGNVAFDTLASE